MPHVRGTRYPLLGNAGSFLPSDLDGLRLWTRFNQGITVTGSGVSQWDDVSGEGNHLLQGTDTYRPSKEADGSILFDGVDNWLRTSGFTLEQPETVYILGKQITWTSGEYIFDGQTVVTGMVRQVNGGLSPDLEFYAGTLVKPNSDLALDTYGVITAVFNGASSALQIDDNTPLEGNVGTSDMGGITVGASGGSTGQSHIQVKEVLVFNTNHDTATRQRMINYLAGVGGLSI